MAYRTTVRAKAGVVRIAPWCLVATAEEEIQDGQVRVLQIREEVGWSIAMILMLLTHSRVSETETHDMRTEKARKYGCILSFFLRFLYLEIWSLVSVDLLVFFVLYLFRASICCC